MTWFVTIRSDARYSQFAGAASLVEFLNSIPALRQSAPDAFAAADGEPWIAVVLAVCSPEGNYRYNGTFIPQVNVVELVCSDSHDPAWYDALAAQIADFLGWSAYEEHEGRQIWPPTENRCAEQAVAPGRRNI